MKVSTSKLNLNGLYKLFNNNLFMKEKKQTLNVTIKKQIEKYHYVYMKLVKGDVIERSLEKVNTCQEELIKFRENQVPVDFTSQVTNIRFELNKLNSLIHEAKRLENDSRYLELIKQERELKRKKKIIEADYNAVEKREQSLKEALTIAREELRINQRLQGDYVKHLGVFIAIGGFFIYIFYIFIFINFESTQLKNHFKDHRDFFCNEINNMKLYFEDRKESSSNPGQGYLYYIGRYTGINYMFSLFKTKDNTQNNSIAIDSKCEDANNSHLSTEEVGVISEKTSSYGYI